MKKVTATFVAIAFLAGSVSTGYGYSKPVTYNPNSDSVILKQNYLVSPHGWMIEKAINLLRHDGYIQEANTAQQHELSMLEGVTFNDVWGDADLAGASVLDYYIPDSPPDYGYGCVDLAINFAPYKNCTSQFSSHPFYGYGNAAEEAEFRYEYAVRIANGYWGTDPRDFMAGWVNDTLFGQDDPMDGRYASGSGIDTVHHTWGDGQTAYSDFFDMYFNYDATQEVFPGQTIRLANGDVMNNHGKTWFDDHYGDADDIEAYSGYDGHGSAVYANWTLDASGHCITGSDSCAAPMVVRVPVASNAHAFFQLGWAMHLLEDVTTPVHTINSSFETFEIHNDIEQRANEVLASPGVYYNGVTVKDGIPVLKSTDLSNVSQFPPPTCAGQAVAPGLFYKERWYADTLARQPGEGIAHAYVRNSAEASHQFMPYIECIEVDRDKTWDHVGFFTASGLDNGVKSVAGLMPQFMAESGMSDTTPPSVSLSTSTSSPTNHNVLAFTGVANDTGSTVKSVEYSLDDGQTWHAANATDGAFGDNQSEGYNFTTAPLADGTYAVRSRATDVSNNTTPPASQPRTVVVVDTTPPVISIAAPVAGPYSHSSPLTLSYSVTDALSGVNSFTPSLDGSTTLAGHGLASGQPINLLTELGLGSHTFMITASDNATNSAVRSVTFSIVVTADSIKDDVSQFLAAGSIKNSGEANSLLAKLNAAAAARASGKCSTAANNYQAFINELQAQMGKGVDAAAAQIMIADAQYLIAHCP